jgi:hypothetical protein
MEDRKQVRQTLRPKELRTLERLSRNLPVVDPSIRRSN